MGCWGCLRSALCRMSKVPRACTSTAPLMGDGDSAGPSAIRSEVAKFRAWAQQYPAEDRYGEWECGYQAWTELHHAFIDCLETVSAADLCVDVVDDLIYAIARDNEISYLSSQLGQRPLLLSELLPYILSCEEPDTRWQTAKQLGKHVLPFATAESALLQLVEDQDEYVRRIALQALGFIGSPHAERLCRQAWESGHEYQRIMALWVLLTIESRQLGHYLALAREDGSKYLCINAAQIESGDCRPDWLAG